MAERKNNAAYLRPTNTLTKQELLAQSAKGGRASGETRRRKKDLRAAFSALLTGRTKDPDNPNKAITGAEYLALKMFQKAAAGNVIAFKLIAEITGEYKQAVQVDQTISTERQGMSLKEAREFLAEIEKEI